MQFLRQLFVFFYLQVKNLLLYCDAELDNFFLMRVVYCTTVKRCIVEDYKLTAVRYFRKIRGAQLMN
jgi:hypothetical protein